jgi:WD40 repeat protein
VACLAEHQLNVSDLAWAGDSTELLSAGFDSVAKLWDVNRAESIRYNPALFTHATVP